MGIGIDMKSEDFQKLKKGQILIFKYGDDTKGRHIYLVTDIDYKKEICLLLGCSPKVQGLPSSLVSRAHYNSGKYGCDTCLDRLLSAYDQCSKLTFLLEHGRSVESVLRDAIDEEIKKQTEELQRIIRRREMEIEELYKGIRVL